MIKCLLHNSSQMHKYDWYIRNIKDQRLIPRKMLLGLQVGGSFLVLGKNRVNIVVIHFPETSNSGSSQYFTRHRMMNIIPLNRNTVQ